MLDEAREKEIRHHSDLCGHQDYLVELLAEVDALRSIIQYLKNNRKKMKIEISLASQKGFLYHKKLLNEQAMMIETLRTKIRNYENNNKGSPRLAAARLKEENLRLRERIKRLQIVLSDWLAATPTDRTFEYCKINQYQAWNANRILKEDDEAAK